jgi:S-DNA-T family DNA segregation ATPase FtsK/SpoIIIE
LQREKYNLGQETLNFYAEGEDGLLSADDVEYLKLLIRRRTTEFREEEDTAFYEAHRNELKEDKKLKSAWDRFVFGRSIETTDLLAGIASAMEPLFNRRPSGSGRKLLIRCDRATKRDLRELNEDAGLFFAHRYAGLRRLFNKHVSWDVGDLFDFTNLVATWRAAGKYSANRSVAKPALQLKFVLELETLTDTGATVSCSTQIIWKFEPSAASSQFADDWSRLSDHPMVVCRASREFSGAKSRAKTVDLADVKTFVPAYDRDRGSFVSIYKQERDKAEPRSCWPNPMPTKTWRLNSHCGLFNESPIVGRRAHEQAYCRPRAPFWSTCAISRRLFRCVSVACRRIGLSGTGKLIPE